MDGVVIPEQRAEMKRVNSLYKRVRKNQNQIETDRFRIGSCGAPSRRTARPGGEQLQLEGRIDRECAMRVKGCLFASATVALLTGCPGMSTRDNARFQAVVAKNVSPGMSFVTGIEHLVKAGFSCDDRVAAPTVSCTRDRQSLLPYACIQRVNLMTDAERRTIVEVIPKPIGCAGL